MHKFLINYTRYLLIGLGSPSCWSGLYAPYTSTMTKDEQYKDEICRLYLDEGYKLEDVKTIMKEEYKFEARYRVLSYLRQTKVAHREYSVSWYRKRLREWRGRRIDNTGPDSPTTPFIAAFSPASELPSIPLPRPPVPQRPARSF